MKNPLDNDPGRTNPAAQPSPASDAAAFTPLVLPHDPGVPPLNGYRRGTFDTNVTVYDQNRCYAQQDEEKANA